MNIWTERVWFGEFFDGFAFYFPSSLPLIQRVCITHLLQSRHIARHCGRRVQYDIFSSLKEQPSLYYFPNYHTTVLDKGGQVSLLIQSEGEEVKASQPPTCNDCTLCYVHVWVGTFGEKHWAWSPCTFLRSLTYFLLSKSINIFWASICDVTFSIPVLFQLRPFISCITGWLLLDENTYAPRLRNVYRKIYSKTLHW